MPPRASRPRARASGSGRAENARATVQRKAICSLAATVPGGKPMSTATIWPSPRGPSRKVGTCAASVPAAANVHGVVELGLPAVHLM